MTVEADRNQLGGLTRADSISGAPAASAANAKQTASAANAKQTASAASDKQTAAARQAAAGSHGGGRREPPRGRAGGWVDAGRARPRLFDQDGTLIADSSRLIGPGGQVEIEMLPPPENDTLLVSLVTRLYDSVVSLIPR